MAPKTPNPIPGAGPAQDKFWPPIEATGRIKRYKKGYLLYDGKHKQLWDPKRDESAMGPYVTANALKAIARVISDRMALETPTATVGEDEAVNEALATILQDSDWGRLVLRSLRGWIYRGDVVYKAIVRDQAKAQPQGFLRRAANVLRPLSAKTEIVIREVLPQNFFPTWDSSDSGLLIAADVTWEIATKRNEKGVTAEWLQREEHHTPGLIENKLYILRRDEGTQTKRFQREEISLGTVPQFKDVKKQVETKIDQIPLVHIPNNEITEELPWGNSEYTDIQELQRTLNERATDHRHMMRKWADPPIGGVDPSYLRPNPETGEQPILDIHNFKIFPSEPGEPIPQFIDVPLQNYPHSDNEADKSLERMLWVVGISPESMGISQGGFPESGRAIRLRQSDTLGTVARKWVSYEPGLQRLLAIALDLNHAHAGGPEAPEPEEIEIERGDGLVKDERDLLENLALKQALGMSEEAILREQEPKWDDEAIEKELARRKAEQPDAVGAQVGTRNAPPDVEARQAELAGEEGGR